LELLATLIWPHQCKAHLEKAEHDVAFCLATIPFLDLRPINRWLVEAAASDSGVVDIPTFPFRERLKV
jgi:hypothetical protein